MVQTMNQLKRNISGYRLVTHLGLEVVTDKVYEELEGLGLIGSSRTRVSLEEDRNLIYEEARLKEADIDIKKVAEVDIGDRKVLEVLYMKESELRTAEYIMEKKMTEGVGHVYRLIYIEEE